MQQLKSQVLEKRRLEVNDSIRFLNQLKNQDLEITQNKVNLMCPYTRERIKIPVRGKQCSHFTCFCLKSLVQTHSKTRFWNCPICECRANEPVIDMWIYKMLMDNQLGSEVILYPDGKYEWAKQQIVEEIDLEESSQPVKMAEPRKEPIKDDKVLDVDDIIFISAIEEQPQQPAP